VAIQCVNKVSVRGIVHHNSSSGTDQNLRTIRLENNIINGKISDYFATLINGTPDNEGLRVG
jgi:hypothetical protein